MKKYYVKTTSSGKEVTRVNVFIQGEDEKGVWGHYSGSVKDYMPHGPGHLVFIDGSEYIGDFFDGKFHGKGVYTQSDGSGFQGAFENGEKIELFPHVQIGNQIWMSENLNVVKFRNGDPIPQIKSNKKWVKAGEEGKPAWCYYENDPENGKKYGRLYNWYAINDPRGLAPEGWHVASDDEWTQLIEFLGGEVSKKKLKSKIGWNKNGNGSDDYCFSTPPGGSRWDDGYFNKCGYWCYMWSSTQIGTDMAWCRFFEYDFPFVRRLNISKGDGLAVRCLRIRTI